MLISAVIIVKDSASTISNTLDSLKEFDEVIVYDNGSVDDTLNILKKYANVNLIQGDFLGFGPTKNKAASFAKNEWIFSLDSDEIIPQDLYDELLNVNLVNNNVVYEIKRDNFFMEKQVKYSGWGKDYLVRIYNKNVHSFNNNMVHEYIAENQDSVKVRLRNSFKHDAVINLNQFLQKVIKYSDIASKDKKTCSFLIVILKAFFAFFKTYFLQLGFLDGWRGFVIAVSNFNGKFFRYAKKYINCHK